MRIHSPKPALALLTAFLLLLLGTLGCKENPVDATGDAAGNQEAVASKTLDDEDAKGGGLPFADSEVFFEFNTTDNDLGLQIFLDAEGWEKVSVTDPDKKKIVEIKTKGPLSELGITELRFESAEPSPAEVLALFPPGDYAFAGKTVDGDKLKGEGTLSHHFAPQPTFSPSGGEVVDPNNTVVTWSAPGAELVEVIITSDDFDDVFDVIVSASATSLNVPPQFLKPEAEYKIEILSYAENGNRTIVESSFATM